MQLFQKNITGNPKQFTEKTDSRFKCYFYFDWITTTQNYDGDKNTV